MAVCAISENPSGNIDEINPSFLRFEARHHPDDYFVLRDVPLAELAAPWAGLHELFDRDRVPAQDPIFSLEDSAPFSFVGIRVRNHDKLCRDLCGYALHPEIEVPNQRPLKIIETESVCGMKNDRNSSQPRSPAPQNAGF